MLGVRKTLALKHRNHQLAVERLQQVVAQTALESPRLGLFGFFGDQRHRHAGHQHRLAAQQVDQLCHWQRQGLKVLAIGPDPYRGAGFAVTVFTLLAHLQGLYHISAREYQAGHLALAVSGGFQPRGQRVGHAHTDTMQTARKTVGAALALVKLATGMQPREHQFDHGCVFFRVQSKGNSAAIVFDADRAVGVQNDLDFFTMPGQGFIGCVVQHLLDDMQGIVGAGVHPGSLLDGLQALEHADGIF